MNSSSCVKVVAHDALAEYYHWADFAGLIPPKQALTERLWAALRALEIDNNLAETHALLGQLCKIRDYNWDDVQREFVLAVKLNPTSLVVKFRYANSGLMPMGRLDEAVAELWKHAAGSG